MFPDEKTIPKKKIIAFFKKQVCAEGMADDYLLILKFASSPTLVDALQKRQAFLDST